MNISTHKLLDLVLTSAGAANKEHGGRGLGVQLYNLLLCWRHSEGEVHD